MLLFVVPITYFLLHLLEQRKEHINQKAKIWLIPITLLASTYFLFDNSFSINKLKKQNIMKSKASFLFILCSFLFSCSNNLNINDEIQEYKTYEKVNSSTLQQQILDYLGQKTLTRNSSPTTPFEPTDIYDITTQEIVCPNPNSDETMIVVRNVTDANNIMAFYKKNDTIESCLIIEYNQTVSTTNETSFICKDQDNIPIFKAIINNTNETCEVVEIYEGIELINTKTKNWGCNLALGLSGIIWSTAASTASMGVGVVVAIGWLVFQTWACDVATSSTTVPDETPDTDETVPVSEDSTNSTEP